MARDRRLRRVLPDRGTGGAIVQPDRRQPFHRARHAVAPRARLSAGARGIGVMTYAEVIGDPIAHSKSPVIPRFWLNALGIDADYRATHVTAEGLGDYFAARRADPDWLGCNITAPPNQAAPPFLAECRAVR